VDDLTRQKPGQAPREVVVSLRMRQEAVDEIDRFAASLELKRSDALRMLLRVGLTTERGRR